MFKEGGNTAGMCPTEAPHKQIRIIIILGTLPLCKNYVALYSVWVKQ